MTHEPLTPAVTPRTPRSPRHTANVIVAITAIAMAILFAFQHVSVDSRDALPSWDDPMQRADDPIQSAITLQQQQLRWLAATPLPDAAYPPTAMSWAMRGSFQTVGILVNWNPNNAPESLATDPCTAPTSRESGERFVSVIHDRPHKRTVYVPCDGMVYVVPDFDKSEWSEVHVTGAGTPHEIVQWVSATRVAEPTEARNVQRHYREH